VSPHTKRGRRVRLRQHFAALSRRGAAAILALEAAAETRRFTAWMKAQMRASPFREIQAQASFVKVAVFSGASR
jgi:hypothetical protein